MAERTHGEVDITIDEEGGVTFDVKGVKGTGCVDLTKVLEKELGKAGHRRLKGEFHQKPRQHLRQGQDG